MVPEDEHYHKVFVHGSWYDFSPDIINSLYKRTAHEDKFEANLDLIASELTHAHHSSSAAPGLESSALTSLRLWVQRSKSTLIFIIPLLLRNLLQPRWNKISLLTYWRSQDLKVYMLPISLLLRNPQLLSLPQMSR